MNQKKDFTFLTRDQIFELAILKKYGKECAITDLAILLGGWVSNYKSTNKNNTRKDRNGMWWTKTYRSYIDYSDERHSGICVVETDGGRDLHNIFADYIGSRPAISFSSIKSDILNEMIILDGIKEIFYGEYPQTIVDESYSGELEYEFKNGMLKKTDKKYTLPCLIMNKTLQQYEPINKKYTEYEYKGNKYIRFVADSKCNGKTLSDGRKIEAGKVYWVKVEPISWLVDEEADIALSKNILFAGVIFDDAVYYSDNFDFDDNKFKETKIKKFMDEFFSKEIERKAQKETSKFSNNEKLEQDNMEGLQSLKKKIKQLDEEIKQSKEKTRQLQEIRKTIVSQLHNQKVYTNNGKKKHK